MKTVIGSYCKISGNRVTVNDNSFAVETPEIEIDATLSALYKKVGLNYSKFHKMDRLCKLGILAAELSIREEKEWQHMEKSRIALVFANHSSSLESDRSHAMAIADKSNYFPSPSVFVYTLPNIVTGEIAIRHKITGENAFFVTAGFDAALLVSYTNILLQSTATDFVVCGWVNADTAQNEAFVYCVKKSNFDSPGLKEHNRFQALHSPEILDQLFNK